MKKYLLLSFLLISSFCFAQKDTTALSDTAKLTISKVYSDVKSGLQGLAQALKVPANHVYSVVIRQQTTGAISDLVFIVIFVILSFVLYKVAMKMYKAVTADGAKNSDDAIGVMIFTFVLCGISTLISICSFWSDYSTIVRGFVNPEYGAIKDIVSFIK